MSKLAQFLNPTIGAANPANPANPADSSGRISNSSNFSSGASATSNSSDDLVARILRMAKRWGYSPDELQEALTGARSDLQVWTAWTERDERDFGGCVTQQDFAKAYVRARGLE
jgi:hypothetical protein